MACLVIFPKIYAFLMEISYFIITKQIAESWDSRQYPSY